MSFFTGFVNGAFRGMDWREGRDDRQTERERNATRWNWENEEQDWQREDRGWEREDRQFTLSERSRATARRAQAELRRQADLDAWGRTADAMSAPPASTRAPVAIAPDLASGAMSPPSRAGSNAVSIMPAPVAASPAPVEAAERPAAPRQRANRDQKLGPGAEDNAPVPTADSLRRDADRRAVSIAAAESTAPQPARAPVSIASDADIDGIAAGLSAAPQPSPRDRSAEMIAAQDTIPPRRSPERAPMPSLPESVTRPRQRTQEQIDADLARMPPAFRGEPVAPADPDVRPAPSGVQAEMQRQSQADRAAVGAAVEAFRAEPDASMTDDERAARERLMRDNPGMTEAPRRPSSVLEMPPASPTRPPVSIADQPQPALRPASTAPAPAQQPASPPASVRRDMEQIAQAAPQQMPQTAGGTPTASVQAVAAETVAAARGGRGNTPRAREQVAERFVDTYRRDALPPIVDHFIRTGRISEASQALEFFDQLEVRAGMQSWARAIHAYSVNDTEGMLDGLLEAYNNEAYYPDGLSAVRSGTRMVTNEDGEVIGADIALRDNATGREFTQQIRGLDDMIAVGIGTLSPEAAFEHYLEAAGARRAARSPAIEPAQMRQIEDAAFERASQGGLRQPTPEQVRSEMQAILSRMGVSASGMGARAAIPVLP